MYLAHRIVNRIPLSFFVVVSVRVRCKKIRISIPSSVTPERKICRRKLMVTASGAKASTDWGGNSMGVRRTTMEGVIQDRCGIFLLVLLAHPTRRRLKMSQSPFFWMLYTGPKMVKKNQMHPYSSMCLASPRRGSVWTHPENCMGDFLGVCCLHIKPFFLRKYPTT